MAGLIDVHHHIVPKEYARALSKLGVTPAYWRSQARRARIRILRCGRGGFVALGGAVLPGHAAGEPFADPQHALEVTNGCPPAFRA